MLYLSLVVQCNGNFSQTCQQPSTGMTVYIMFLTKVQDSDYAGIDENDVSETNYREVQKSTHL